MRLTSLITNEEVVNWNIKTGDNMKVSEVEVE